MTDMADQTRQVRLIIPDETVNNSTNRSLSYTHLRSKQCVNLLDEVCSSFFLEVFLHQKSYKVDMLGFSVFLHYFPLTSIQLTSQSGAKARFSDVMTF